MLSTDPTFPPPVRPSPVASRRRLRIAQGVLLLFHVTGFLGLAFSQNPAFYLQFVPLNLLLTAALLVAFQPDRTPTFWWFLLSTAVVGFFVEVAGVRTELIFGQYTYGNTLGLQWLGVPLLIGINWWMLTYMGAVLSRYVPAPEFVRALVATALIVGLDVCLEPVAVRFDFWEWSYNIIPMQNFKGWFAIALILQVYANRTPFTKRNELVPFVYLLQLLFFFGLGFFVR